MPTEDHGLTRRFAYRGGCPCGPIVDTGSKKYREGYISIITVLFYCDIKTCNYRQKVKNGKTAQKK